MFPYPSLLLLCFLPPSAAASIQSFIRGYFVRQWHYEMLKTGGYYSESFADRLQNGIGSGGIGNTGGGDMLVSNNNNYTGNGRGHRALSYFEESLSSDSMNSPQGYHQSVDNTEEGEQQQMQTNGVFEKMYDDSAQAWYWYNDVTGEASWTDPNQD